MDINRGDIVVVAARGPYTTKPRRAVVVQDDAYNGIHDSVTVCPITTTIVDSPRFRVPVVADEATGLQQPSQVMVDKVVTVPRARLRAGRGRVPDATLAAVSDALRDWLAL